MWHHRWTQAKGLKLKDDNNNSYADSSASNPDSGFMYARSDHMPLAPVAVAIFVAPVILMWKIVRVCSLCSLCSLGRFWQVLQFLQVFVFFSVFFSSCKFLQALQPSQFFQFLLHILQFFCRSASHWRPEEFSSPEPVRSRRSQPVRGLVGHGMGPNWVSTMSASHIGMNQYESESEWVPGS